MERSNPYVRLLDIYTLTALYRHGTYEGTKQETGINAPWQDRIIEQVEAWTGFKLFDRSMVGHRAMAAAVLPTKQGGAWLAGAGAVDSDGKLVERVADGLAEPEYPRRKMMKLSLDHILTFGNVHQITDFRSIENWLQFRVVSKPRIDRTPTRAYKTVQPYILDLNIHIKALYALTNELKRRTE